MRPGCGHRWSRGAGPDSGSPSTQAGSRRDSRCRRRARGWCPAQAAGCPAKTPARSPPARPGAAPSGRSGGRASGHRLTPIPSPARLARALTFCPQGGSNPVVDRSARILLVDDERSIQTLLSYPLRKEGYDVVQATDGREALDRFDEQPFDLVVLDLMLPKVDGLEVCRQLRSRSPVPIIMLTAKSEEIDKVVGLELGADDYITKPFSLREFSSRIKATLRRAEMSRAAELDSDAASLSAKDLRIDFAKRSVRIRGRDVELTFVEFEILSAVARAPGRVFTRDMLLLRVWGDSAYRDPRTIDVHIRHLREKIERDPQAPEYLFTVRGVGYRFRDTES